MEDEDYTQKIEQESEYMDGIVGLAGAGTTAPGMYPGSSSSIKHPTYYSHADNYDSSHNSNDFLEYVAKFYINGIIPVYRRYWKESHSWEYRLFEDSSSAMTIRIKCDGQTVTDHLKMILSAISESMSGMKSIKRAR